MKKTVYVFDHIPKCAGTSMHTLLAESIPEYRLVRTVGELLAYADTITTDGGDSYFLGGHCVYGIHELLPAGWTTKYFTLLREPLQVAYSFYKYSRDVGGTSYGSFLDYLYENPCNSMTMFLGNSCEQAISRLENYSFVGFLDRLDAAMASISDLLRRSLPPLPLYNVTRDGQDYLREMDLTALRRDINDFRLYKHFRHIANDRVLAAQITAVWPTTSQHSEFNGTPERFESAEFHYTTCNKAVKAWYQNKYNTKQLSAHLVEEKDLDAINVLGNMLARLNATIDDACFEKIVDTEYERLVECLHTSQVNTKERFERVYAIANNLLQRIRFATHTSVFIGARNILLFLAMSQYAKENCLCEGILRELLDLSPLDCKAWRFLAIHLRLKGDHAGALASLISIPRENRDTTYCNEYLITKTLYDGHQITTEELLTDRTFTPHVNSQDLLERNFSLSSRVRLSDIGCRKVLIIRSGPLPVLDDALQAFNKIKCAITLILQKSLFDNFNYSTHKRYVIDDGWFDPAKNTGLYAIIKNNFYDAIILICSEFLSLNRLHNFIEFCRDIPHSSMYAYPISNLFAQLKKKSIIPLR